MYQDPKRVRRHKQTIYLDDYELAIVEAHANYSGLPKATLMRQMAFESAKEVPGTAPTPQQPTQPMVAERST
ncbi:hypothetical protein FIU88_05670 [Halomonas sp. THAF12]|uniref:hypothetical protein n=1 Tax=Halomonas sp. THAF12 TaxID=2587849 RepID=UPI001267F0E3|nr:hypothetical protein [Halomonas sp. THAF12]QFT84467.1 hypothetical protein FIU88_05670 [Halomonas sp. THAF12]